MTEGFLALIMKILSGKFVSILIKGKATKDSIAVLAHLLTENSLKIVLQLSSKIKKVPEL